MMSYMVGTWNMGQLKNVYYILQAEPQGNVKTVWVSISLSLSLSLSLALYIYIYIYTHTHTHIYIRITL
jgi:hypothetical protein